MSVLHIVPALFGSKGVVGGAERYAFELARHMSHSVPTTLLTFGEEDQETRTDNFLVRVIGRPYLVRGQRTNPIAPRLLKEVVQADIVHCHQQHVLASSIAAAASRITGRKVFVSDLGGAGFDISSYISTDRWFNGHLHISQYSKDVFGHTGKKWAHVIYGGVDTELFSPDRAEERNGSVLFVGRLLPHKGIDDVVRAIPADMSLEIIGKPYDERYVSDLESLAKGKRVTFHQNADDKDLVKFYRRATCIVLPSVYRTCYGYVTNIPELLGQTLLEGMACGTPAICTNVASMPEVVEDQVTGFVVPPNDPDSLREKFLWLRDHPAEVERLGAAARERVLERFTWKTVVKRCLDIYSGSIN